MWLRLSRWPNRQKIYFWIYRINMLLQLNNKLKHIYKKYHFNRDNKKINKLLDYFKAENTFTDTLTKRL